MMKITIKIFFAIIFIVSLFGNIYCFLKNQLPIEGLFEFIKQTCQFVWSNIIESIKAISQIAWPLVTLVIINKFKEDISYFIRQIKECDLFGNKFKLNELDKLYESVSASHDKNVPTPKLDTRKGDDIIELCKFNPKLGVIKMYTTIEKSLLNLVENLIPKEYKAEPLHILLSKAVDNNYIPLEIVQSFNSIQMIRNKIIHESNDISQNEISKFIDIGLSLLETIEAIPVGFHRFRKVYDKDCSCWCISSVLDNENTKFLITVDDEQTADDIIYKLINKSLPLPDKDQLQWQKIRQHIDGCTPIFRLKGKGYIDKDGNPIKEQDDIVITEDVSIDGKLVLKQGEEYKVTGYWYHYDRVIIRKDNSELVLPTKFFKIKN
ncbi:MAG: hypothetical protein HQK49_17320 [Oligoflexia bacterium]|nr:hypothetical protein [Oligoflexia bacterium]